MRQIWKFPLGVAPDDATVTLEMPAGAQIVQFAGGEHSAVFAPTIWAIVDTDEQPEPRRFTVYGTGHPLPRNGRHIGTYFDGPFVWHVFELVGEALPDGLVLPADAEAEAAYRTLTGSDFVATTVQGDAAWLAPDDEPLTTEQMMAVATLQDHGFGAVVSA